MSLTLIVTEKDSVAKAFATAIDAKQQNGYYEGNGYVVAPCRGHLCELATPDAYDAALKEWNLNTLPIIPDQFEFTVKNMRRLSTIRDWLSDERVVKVVNACDGDREGEAIFREVYQMCGCTKPVYRVWISSMEDSAIRKGLKDMKPGSEYDNLADAAYSRNLADWLIGINATRLFTLSLRSKRVLTIGRVQTPTVNMVVEREREIREFKPVDYWVVSAHLENGLDVTRRSDEGTEADKTAEVCKGADATITKVEQKENRENPPKLYDLTSLQQDCNKLFHISASDTLAIMQEMYEKKFATYPRTDSQYITEDEVDMALAAMQALSDGNLVATSHPENIHNVVNKKKVEGHPALLPTPEGVKELLDACAGGYETLSNEWKVLLLVAFRLMEATSDPRLTLSTSVKVDIEGYEFNASGSVTKADGWKAVDREKRAALGMQSTEKDTVLPAVAEGDATVCEDTKVEKKQTSPPSRYTEATLLEAMRTCGKKLEDESQREAMKDRGLGTPATRADILERIIVSGANEGGYITRGNDGKDKTHLYPTNRATALMKILPDALKDPATTGAWEYSLSQIEKGNERKEAFLDDIEEFVRGLVDEELANPRTDDEVSRFAGGSYANILGACPICGGAVVPYEYTHDKDGKKLAKKKTGYRCTTKGCKLFGSNVIGGKKITDGNVKQLLETGSTGIIAGFWSDNKQKYFDAVLYLERDESGQYTGKTKMRFPADGDYGPAVCNCPVCGSSVSPFSWTKTVMDDKADRKPKPETVVGWRCSDRSCSMEWLTNPYHGQKITERLVVELLTKGETDYLSGFVGKTGTTYPAKLKLERDASGHPTGHISMEYPDRSTQQELNAVCDCPACGSGKIIWFRYKSSDDGEMHTAYKCSNRDCTVKPLWPKSKHDFTTEEVKKLFKTGRTGLIHTFKKKDGTPFSAKLAANRDEMGRIIATKYEYEWR